MINKLLSFCKDLHKQEPYIFVYILILVSSVSLYVISTSSERFISGKQADRSIGLKIEGVMKIDDRDLQISIADNRDEQAEGLSHIASISLDEGMLFVFEREGVLPFWMKEMNFPIDMVWLDKDLNVVHIESNAKPEDYPDIYKNITPALYVLEVSAGNAAMLGLQIGSKVSYRGFKG